MLAGDLVVPIPCIQIVHVPAPHQQPAFGFVVGKGVWHFFRTTRNRPGRGEWGASSGANRGGPRGRPRLESANRSPNVWSQMTVRLSSAAVPKVSPSAVNGILKPGCARSDLNRVSSCPQSSVGSTRRRCLLLLTFYPPSLRCVVGTEGCHARRSETSPRAGTNVLSRAWLGHGSHGFGRRPAPHSNLADLTFIYLWY
jgi:hypothetical protein